MLLSLSLFSSYALYIVSDSQWAAVSHGNIGAHNLKPERYNLYDQLIVAYILRFRISNLH